MGGGSRIVRPHNRLDRPGGNQAAGGKGQEVLEPCGRLHIVFERIAGRLPHLKTDILPDRRDIRIGAEEGPECKREIEAVCVAQEGAPAFPAPAPS
jgi:hypothetical protein